MKKIVFLFIAAFILTISGVYAQNSPEPKRQNTLPKSKTAKQEYSDFFKVKSPKGWAIEQNPQGKAAGSCGVKFNMQNTAPDGRTQAAIYMDYYPKNNNIAPNPDQFIKNNADDINKLETIKINRRKAKQFFKNSIIFVPPATPEIKVKIIERIIVADTKNKEGFYVFRLYADAYSYEQAGKTFEKTLKTVKLLK